MPEKFSEFEHGSKEIEGVEISKDKESFVEKEALGDLQDLGLDWQDLKDKLTLDIGAGRALIAEAAKKKGVDVISFDINPEMWIEKGVKLPDASYVKGSAEQLPFPDEKFDLIISHAGPFTNTYSKEGFIQMLSEAKRVLKEGGEIRFGPGNLNADIFMDKELFSAEEYESFTTKQRIERIGERSLEFLKSIDKNIVQQPIKEPSHDFPSSNFYALKKLTVPKRK